MKIIFIAKHGSGDNDDEGAVAHALRELGHDVTLVHELKRHRDPVQRHDLSRGTFDLCLFFKWENVGEIGDLSRRVPCVLWYFDLVANDTDPTLAARMRGRREWFKAVMPYCRAGFVTDGDWADRWNTEADRKASVVTTPRLHWLTQGMDERVAGLGVGIGPGPDILFTGMVHHGRKRADHVARLRERYGDRFHVLGDSGPRHRLHGRKLADLFATAGVVVAPDGPVTDRYWSNRVYLTCGLGGFLLHPRCEGLTRQYEPGTELEYYADRRHLEDMINFYLDRSEARTLMKLAGLKATLERNLYRHRVAELIKVAEGLL